MVFAKLWAALAACASALGRIIKSAMTAPDGESWAPGRMMGFATFAVGICAYIRITEAILPKLATAADCSTYFFGSVGYFTGLGAACIALVLGMAPADAGGKWWGRDAAPPGR